MGKFDIDRMLTDLDLGPDADEAAPLDTPAPAVPEDADAPTENPDEKPAENPETDAS